MGRAIQLIYPNPNDNEWVWAQILGLQIRPGLNTRLFFILPWTYIQWGVGGGPNIKPTVLFKRLGCCKLILQKYFLI